jgi:hypothetical protein
MGTENKYYTIQVGISEPQEVEVGTLNKKTGLPIGVTEKALSVLGVVTIPNFSRVWGKRELDKFNKPTGKITFMKWGEPGGEIIEVRRLKGSSSIDKLYQDKAGYKPTDEDMEIVLNNGLNDYEPAGGEASLVALLKVHTFNGSSICRNPENKKVIFEEYDADKVASKILKGDEILFDAMQTIMSIKDNSKKLRVFAELYDIDSAKQDKVILNEIMSRLKANPSNFLDRIEDFKKEILPHVLRANELGLLNLSSPGEIIFDVDGLSPIKTGLKALASDAQIMEYLVDNSLEPENFDAIERLKKAIKVKESQLS